MLQSVNEVSLSGQLPDEELAAARGDPLDSEDGRDGGASPMDSEQMRDLHRRLLDWKRQEQDRQAENRYQMALDHDYYDGIQWTDEDAQALEDRGQAALTFNEVAVHLNWILGTERRNRVDWRVLPRNPDANPAATLKTQVMKYVSDANDREYAMSAAFTEACISGLGWLEDSLSDDKTSEIIYSGAESWRYILHDSFAKRLDLKDGRFIFRWRTIDLDIGLHLFPHRQDAIRRAAMSANLLALDEQPEIWYLGTRISGLKVPLDVSRRTFLSDEVSTVYNRRTRFKLYECWYRVPTDANVMRGGDFHGEVYDPNHQGHAQSIAQGESDYIPAKILQMRCAYFTDWDMLDEMESPFKHNDFPFTPVWCFRRGRDLLPFGFVRGMRDPQDDLNKRMSKSLFMLSVNQLITEMGAFDLKGEYTLQDAIDNASNPAGVFVLKDGSKKFEIRTVDETNRQGQMEHVNLDRSFLQSTSGVTDELMGQKTNAVSGEAIRARQDQGSATTTTPFDNLRLAMRLSGQKTLSNCERFMTLPKIIRLSGDAKAGVEWVRINQPEMQPDGSVRFLNDITNTRCDFVVDEQDFHATLREAMFQNMSQMVGDIAKVAPKFAISMLDIVYGLHDFPGKEEMVGRLQQLIAEFRGETKPTPEQLTEQQLKLRAAAAKTAVDESKADLQDTQAVILRQTMMTTAQPPQVTDTQVPGMPPPQMTSPGLPGAQPAAPQPMPGLAPAPGGGIVPPSVPTPTVPMPGSGPAVPTQPAAPVAAVPPAAPVASPMAGPSSPVAAGAAPDTSGALTALAQIVQQMVAQQAQQQQAMQASQVQMAQAMQALTETIGHIASSVEGVARVGQAATKAATSAGAAAQSAIEQATSSSKAVQEIGQALQQIAGVAEQAQESATKASEALAASKAQGKTISLNIGGKKVEATVTPTGGE